MFRLKLFGGVSVEGPDGPLTGRAVQRRRLALLALLAVGRGRGLTRDKLVAYLWPDSNMERARHLLSDSVYRINQAIGAEALVAVGDELRLNAERLPNDAADFGDAMEAGEWERAVELHSAPFLDGFFLTGADEFERWAEAERQHHARERARALEALAEGADADPAKAIRWWRMLAAADPYSSRVALQLMRALERAGERAVAVQHARIHTVLVREDLGVEPDAEVLSYAERLRTTDAVTQKPDTGVVAAVQSLSQRATESAADGSPLELSSVCRPTRPRPLWKEYSRAEAAGLAASLSPWPPLSLRSQWSSHPSHAVPERQRDRPQSLCSRLPTRARLATRSILPTALPRN